MSVGLRTPARPAQPGSPSGAGEATVVAFGGQALGWPQGRQELLIPAGGTWGLQIEELACGVRKNAERWEIPTKGNPQAGWLRLFKPHWDQPGALVCKDPPLLCGWPSCKHKDRESLPSPTPTWLGCVSLEWPEKLQCSWDTGTPDHLEPLIQRHRPILSPQPLLRMPAGRHHWMHLLGPRPTVCIPFPVPTRTGESVPV